MSDNDTDYRDLPFLDNVDQPFCKSSQANLLKLPLRNAVNSARYHKDSMEELIALLDSTIEHIRSCRGKKKKRTRRKTEVIKDTEYDLP